MRERMRSHALDGFSLVAGLLFLAVGALVAIDASPSRDVDPRWIVAVVLVGLGLAGVLGSIDWGRSTPAGSGNDHEFGDGHDPEDRAGAGEQPDPGDQPEP